MSQESAEMQKSRETPARIRLAAQAMLSLFYSAPEVEVFAREEAENKENIACMRAVVEKNPDAHFVVTTNHWSNADGGAAAAKLGKMFDFQFVVDSSHYREGAPQRHMYGFLTGGDARDRFTPVTSDGRFVPEEFDGLSTALLEKGRTAWIAAHSWTNTGAMKKGKIGAVYLAHLLAREIARQQGKQEGYAYILPTAFDGGPSALEPGDYLGHLWNRPAAHYHVGRPLGLNPIEGFDTLVRYLHGESLTDEEKLVAQKAQRELEAQGDEVARAVSELLPEVRRGPYAMSNSITDRSHPGK